MFANEQKKLKIEQIKNWIVTARRNGAIVSKSKLKGTIMQVFGTSIRTANEYLSELRLVGFIRETEGHLYLDEEREKAIFKEAEEMIKNQEIALKEFSTATEEQNA